MSSEWDKPDAIHAPTDTINWDQPYDRPELPPISGEFSQQQASALEDEDDSDGYAAHGFTPLSHLWRQVAPFVIPVLCGVIVYLITLSLPFPHLPWPVVVLLFLAIAVLQGTLLFYNKTNQVGWFFSLLSGILLFLFIRTMATFGLVGSLIFLLLVAVGCVLAFRYYFRMVHEGFVEVVNAMGKHSRTLYPGPNFILPWETSLGPFDIREKHWECPSQQVSLPDNKVVIIKAVISYQLSPEDAHFAASQAQNWEETLQTHFRTVIHSISDVFTEEDFRPSSTKTRLKQPAGLVASDVLAEPTGRDKVTTFLKQHLEELVASWGVQINRISLFEPEILPRGSKLLEPTPAASSPQAETSSGNVAGSPSDTTIKVKASQTTAEPVTSGKVPVPSASADPLLSSNLKNAYNQVRQGNIRDPQTIRRLAKQFEDISMDPVQAQKVDFDAGRAAVNLYRCAQTYDDMAAASRINPIQPQEPIKPIIDETPSTPLTAGRQNAAPKVEESPNIELPSNPPARRNKNIDFRTSGG